MTMAVTYATFGGQIVHEERGGVERVYVPDPLGSTAMLTDLDGNVTDRFEYRAYGEERVRTGTTPTPFRFVGALGYYRDAAGRMYVRARTYLANLARWLTVDPLWPDEKAYHYVQGKPSYIVDPLGLNGEFVLPAPPPGISPAVWGAIVAYLVSLEIAFFWLVALLLAIIALIALIGVACDTWKRYRYRVCPAQRNGSGLRGCKPGDGCLQTVSNADAWKDCASIQAFLTVVCFQQNPSHDEAVMNAFRAFLKCESLIISNCNPINIFCRG